MKRSEFMLGGTDFKDLKASQIMEADVVVCQPNNTWKQIASLMTHGGFGDIPVAGKDKTLLGIITEHDLLKVFVKGKDVEDITADNIMTKDPICVSAESGFNEIVKILVSKHLIRVPVVNNGKLIGIVSRRDIIFAFTQATQKPPGLF